MELVLLRCIYQEVILRVLITGGAGFVGSTLALKFKEDNPSSDVVVLDNLRRRGSELNLSILKERGILFVHGDIRNKSDLADLPGNFDVFVEASAEPSVLAGVDGSADYLLQTNLIGTLNCLEFARYRASNTLFLSTSRVYSINPLREIQLKETKSRFEISDSNDMSGLSEHGISEDFITREPRSLYGASKLASELIVQEYAFNYGMNTITNRCGVIAGRGQFGKVDQGVFTMWVANHIYKKPLKYIGFNGHGKQVRDLLHPHDLYELIVKQLNKITMCSGEVYNVGGGAEVSTSLLELTQHCQEVTDSKVDIASVPDTSSVDIPLYISDSRRAIDAFDWKPSHTVLDIVHDISSWINENKAKLEHIFC